MILIYLLTTIGLTPGSSNTVHIYTKAIHRTTQLTTYRTTHITTNWAECGLCPVFASYTLAFVLQLREKHGKTCQSVNDLIMFSDFVIIMKMIRLLIANKFSRVSDLKFSSYFIQQRYYFTRQQSRGTPIGSRNFKLRQTPNKLFVTSDVYLRGGQ